MNYIESLVMFESMDKNKQIISNLPVSLLRHLTCFLEDSF